MHSLEGIAPEAPAHVSVRLWAVYGSAPTALIVSVVWVLVHDH
jgi:hypothetical protein